MAGLPGSIPSMLPAGPDELVRRMRDLERHLQEMGASVAPSFDPVIADLAAKQAALAAQVAFLAGQSFAYSSAKAWSLTGGGVSGTGAWEFLAYDPTYDDIYTFQASSTGVLKIDISATVVLNNGSATNLGGTARGYQLSWSGGGLGMQTGRSALISGENCGMVQVSASNTAIVTVPSNATVTLLTLRAKYSPIAPETTWHEIWDTTVVVTRVGI
jgi:hypothetical protein